jgi:predicted DCC family thiol-disulfide oxidoreductase YuxK
MFVIPFSEVELYPCIDYQKIEGIINGSAIFINGVGQVYVRSEAILNILKLLGGLWLIPWLVLSIVPRRIREYFYRTISQNRYKWFGKRAVCYYLPSPKK